MLFRPLKRAVGDEGCANPQSDDWGYHPVPAQAGFYAGFLDSSSGARRCTDPTPPQARNAGVLR
jgi:hypothetical protein